MLVLTLLVFMAPTRSFGQAQGVPQPIQEVFQSNLVYPQEENELQLTFFPSFRKNNARDRTRTLVEIEYGVTDAFQVIAEWEGLIHHNPRNGPTLSGPGNLELGGQYSWMGLGDGNTHFSIGTLVEIPTGTVDNGLTEGILEWNPFMVLARDFPGWNQSQIFFELGYIHSNRVRFASTNQPPTSDSLVWNVGGFFPLGAWRAVLEINGRNNEFDNGTSNEVFLTPGVIYKLSREWEIGVGAPVGLTQDSDDYRVVGYLMYEFELDD